MTMDWDYIFHTAIYLILKPITLVASCLIMPLRLFFKLLKTIFGYFSVENMKGKVVLITGASSGVGEQMAYDYAKRGALLVIAARRENRLKEVAKKARSLGSPDVLSVCTNISNIDDCKRVIIEAINHFGRLDHLVNNAGLSCVVPFELISDVTKFEAVMDTNFWGAVYLINIAIPHLKRSKGKIVIISSCCSILNPPKSCFYSASKAALDSFCNVLRVELGPEIKMTIVTLGFIESEMTQGKHLSQEGSIKVQPEIYGMARVMFPHMSARTCASAIVRAICRGEKHVVVPKWYKPQFMLKTLCPEFLDWVYKIYFNMDQYVK